MAGFVVGSVRVIGVGFLRQLTGGFHEPCLDLIGSEILACEHSGRSAARHGRGHAGAAYRHVIRAAIGSRLQKIASGS